MRCCIWYIPLRDISQKRGRDSGKHQVANWLTSVLDPEFLHENLIFNLTSKKSLFPENPISLSLKRNMLCSLSLSFLLSESRSVVSDLLLPHGLYSPKFSRPEHWSGQPFPSPGDLPNPGIEPISPALQADSLPAEPQRSPRILERVAYPFSSGCSHYRN